MTKPVCAVVGVGPGNGLSLAQRYAADGYRVALMARSEDKVAGWAADIDGAVGVPCDAADEASVGAAFDRVRAELGPVHTLIYNAGSAVWGTFEEIDLGKMEQGWRVNALGLVLCQRAVVADQRALGGGVTAVIGASAAWRGRKNSLAFAAAKAAQRSTAQSLARTLGPEGIHVFYVVVDGMVDLAATRARMPDAPDEAFIDPDALATAVAAVAAQPRSAWTFELDLRPHVESW